MSEVVYTNQEEVVCNGGALGHPKIYLNMKKDEEVVCPYCSKVFIFQDKVAKNTA